MKRILLLTLSLVSQIVLAQSLESKWNRMLDKSNTYKSHKIIHEGELSQMWNTVEDSMMMSKVKIRIEQKKVSDQLVEITSLKRKTADAQATLNKANEEKEKAQASRDSADVYIGTLWIALGLVIVGSVILFLMFKKSNSITEQKINDFEDLKKSFEEYKTQKLEIERKLKREIQTYQNQFHEPRHL